MVLEDINNNTHDNPSNVCQSVSTDINSTYNATSIKQPTQVDKVSFNNTNPGPQNTSVSFYGLICGRGMRRKFGKRSGRGQNNGSVRFCTSKYFEF